jgi:hypothetical protein
MTEQNPDAPVEGSDPTADSPNPAAPTYDNNPDAVIEGNDEFEQHKNNAGTSHSQVNETTQQQQQEQDAYDNATAQQDEADASLTTDEAE